jgi:AraC-like DNA-binding protein
MNQEINQIRIRSMSKMLLEMARGNFSNRIPRTEQNDQLEGLIVLMNMAAEEMKESVFHSGFVNPHYNYKNIVQSTFILDEDFIIKSYNSDAPVILGFSTDFLLDKDFSSLLSAESLPLWKAVEEELLSNPDYHTTVELVYVAKNKLLASAFCTVYRLTHCSKILISSVTTVVEETTFKDVSTTSKHLEQREGFSRSADVLLIQNVYDYILDNLDTQLPSMQELSRIFGTNEYKLKLGFKLLFKTSIYQFYNTERLKKAHFLIQQTTIPLKTIAFMTGFSTYPNFSKAFKKQFRYTPMDIKRSLNV